MAKELIIDGINVTTHKQNGAGIYISGTSSETGRPTEVTKAYHLGLYLPDIRDGNLILSDKRREVNPLGKLESSEFIDSLFASLPVPANKGDYDSIESPSMWFFEHDFPSNEFGYLAIKFSAIEEYRTKISSRCDLVDHLDTRNFFMPVYKGQVEDLEKLMAKGDVFAYVIEK